MTSAKLCNVRLAVEGDLSAILALLLTSFRQFPLFDFLYSPLDNDFDVAHDTMFFWRQRLLLDLLDPEAAVTVAEAPLDSHTISASSRDSSEVYQKSLKAQEWTEKNGVSTKSSSTKGCSIVGFAIWRFRLGEKVGAEPNPEKIRRSWYNECRAQMIGWEVELWKRIYQRKDQEPSRFATYIESEHELGKSFYQESCYYLDNLCVDFRYQRRGIGSLLLTWGLKVADEKMLSVGTEAGPKGHGLYLKHGFKQTGWFTVAADGVEFRMTVLKRDYLPK